jgi:hypothetical protein
VCAAVGVAERHTPSDSVIAWLELHYDQWGMRPGVHCPRTPNVHRTFRCQYVTRTWWETSGPSPSNLLLQRYSRRHHRQIWPWESAFLLCDTTGPIEPSLENLGYHKTTGWSQTCPCSRYNAISRGRPSALTSRCHLSWFRALRGAPTSSPQLVDRAAVLAQRAGIIDWISLRGIQLFGNSESTETGFA